MKKIPPCLVGPEACATVHHFVREVITLGRELRLMPPTNVKAYAKRNTHDMGDAGVVGRPSMGFVPSKKRQRDSRLSYDGS